MKAFVIGLSMAIVTLGTAVAQTDPNAPTGPFNPNPPAQFAGQQVPLPCDVAAGVNTQSGATAPGASTAPQAPQAGQQDSAAKDKMAAGTACAGQDRPASGSAPSPAPTNGPRP